MWRYALAPCFPTTHLPQTSSFGPSQDEHKTLLYFGAAGYKNEKGTSYHYSHHLLCGRCQACQMLLFVVEKPSEFNNAFLFSKQLTIVLHRIAGLFVQLREWDDDSR